jgi:plastocyanin
MFRTLIAIAAVMVAGLAAAGADGVSAGGGCHSEELTDARTTEVDLANNCFEPNVVRIDAGEAIAWTNRDEVPHTVTGAAGSFGGYDELAPGEAVSVTFADSGVFPYFCVIHPSMVGAVVVGDGTQSADGDAAAAAAAASGGDDGGLSAGSVAAIAAAVGLGGAALGLVGSRVLSARREQRAAA